MILIGSQLVRLLTVSGLRPNFSGQLLQLFSSSYSKQPTALISLHSPEMNR